MKVILIFQKTTQCAGLNLASLPHNMDQQNTTKSQEALDIHFSLTSTLSHMFFMRMNWMNIRDLPCEEHNQRDQRRQRFRDLVESWQSLNCVYQRSLVGGEILSKNSEELQANLVRVLDTKINLYTSCQVMRVRDCVLITEARALLQRMEELYTDTLQTNM